MTKKSRAYLEALAVALELHGFAVEMTEAGLKVTASEADHEPRLSECCKAAPPRMVVSCRKRRNDFHWFFTNWREPIAYADRIPEAVVVIRGLMTRPRPTVSSPTMPLVSGV